jgi:hypothetical protein
MRYDELSLQYEQANDGLICSKNTPKEAIYSENRTTFESQAASVISMRTEAVESSFADTVDTIELSSCSSSSAFAFDSLELCFRSHFRDLTSTIWTEGEFGFEVLVGESLLCSGKPFDFFGVKSVIGSRDVRLDLDRLSV